MTRRKRELTERQIKRDWPHHVTLPAEALRGNGMAIHGLVKESLGPVWVLGPHHPAHPLVRELVGLYIVRRL